MYYSYQCPYCRKTFYTFSDNKEQASSTLFYGIKKHQRDYGEDEKEHSLDDDPSIEINEIYSRINESSDEPSGAYEL